MLTRVPRLNCRSKRNRTKLKGISISLAVVALAIATSATARSAAQSPESTPRAHLQQYVTQLQANPADDSLRTKIIQLALTLDPKPAVPEEAQAAEGKAKTIFAHATSPDDLKAAAAAFTQASLLAPWVADYYFNEAAAAEKSNQYDEAIHALTYYLLAAPNAPDAGEVRGRIDGLNYEKNTQVNAKEKLRNKCNELLTLKVATAKRYTAQGVQNTSVVVKQIKDLSDGGITISFEDMNRPADSEHLGHYGWDMSCFSHVSDCGGRDAFTVNGTYSATVEGEGLYSVTTATQTVNFKSAYQGNYSISPLFVYYPASGWDEDTRKAWEEAIAGSCE